MIGIPSQARANLRRNRHRSKVGRVDENQYLPTGRDDRPVGNPGGLETDRDRCGSESLDLERGLDHISQRRRALEVHLYPSGDDIDARATQLFSSVTVIFEPIGEGVIPVPGIVSVEDDPLWVAVRVADLLGGRHRRKLPSPMVKDVIVDGSTLTPEQVASVAMGARALPGDDLHDRLTPARSVVDEVTDTGRVVYGITTGFGALAMSNIGAEETETLQYNLIRSHATGIGEPLPDQLVRSMLLLRARTLAQGHSGVRPIVVEKLLELLEKGYLPVVPAKGSVGASGDLAPFAHLTLPLIGEGKVRVDGVVIDTFETDFEPIELRAKEGLSLLNGTEGMTSMGVLGLHRGKNLLIAADVAAALTVEALLGSARPFRPEIHQLRPHPGQVASAARIAALIADSPIGQSHADDFEHAVQDAYSLRCAPQVHGAVDDTLRHLERVLSVELGSVVDNPLVFPDTGEVISGGNFHGEPLAFAMDFSTIALAELGSISERRTDRMLDPVRSNGLPPFLAADPGVESGYMVTQYLQAALVSENKVLSHPSSVDSITTSGSQEDHVSMGWGAGLQLLQVAENVETVLAVEILCAVQGIEYRRPLQPAGGTSAIADLIRSEVPPLDADRAPDRDIASVKALISSGAITAAL